MTQDEIIRMAREAGFTGCLLPEEADNLIGGVFIGDENWVKPLERFAALFAAHEREACAKVCDEVKQAFNKERRYDDAYGAEDCAAAIRARGEK